MLLIKIFACKLNLNLINNLSNKKGAVLHFNHKIVKMQTNRSFNFNNCNKAYQ